MLFVYEHDALRNETLARNYFGALNLLVRDTGSGEVVGTYRLQTGLRAAVHQRAEREGDHPRVVGLLRLGELVELCAGVVAHEVRERVRPDREHRDQG